MIKCDDNGIKMCGMNVEIIAELRIIGSSARKMFAEDFGKETANKLVDAIFSNCSDCDCSKRIKEIIKEHYMSNRDLATTLNKANDDLLKAIFGRGDR